MDLLWILNLGTAMCRQERLVTCGVFCRVGSVERVSLRPRPLGGGDRQEPAASAAAAATAAAKRD